MHGIVRSDVYRDRSATFAGVRSLLVRSRRCIDESRSLRDWRQSSLSVLFLHVHISTVYDFRADVFPSVPLCTSHTSLRAGR